MSDKIFDIAAIGKRFSITRILFPLNLDSDLTKNDSQALRYAMVLATNYRAKLFFYYCSSQPLPDGGKRVREFLDYLVTSQLKSNDTPTLDWQAIIADGNVEKLIVKEVIRSQIDLVVINSQRGSLAASIFGSTAENICREVPCPVLFMRGHKEEWVDIDNKRILLNRVAVAYNFSDFANIALAYGLSLAQEYQAEVDIVNVLQDEHLASFTPAPHSTIDREIKRIHTMLPAEATNWCKIKPVITEGVPYERILDYAENNHVDLICLGAHSAEDKKSYFIGTTVDRVLRKSRCPVLVAKALTNPLVEEESGGTKVLVALDGSSYSELIINSLKKRLWAADTKFRIVMVVEPLSTLGSAQTHYQVPSEVFTASEDVTYKAVEELRAGGLKTSYVIREGMAADQILAEAKSWDADLVILGTHSRKGLSRFFLGSVAERVAAYAPCSVEIVRDKP